MKHPDGPLERRAHFPFASALANGNLVMRGESTETITSSRHTADAGENISWAYGPRNRMVELTGSNCGHALPNGSCTNRGESEPFLAEGTALVNGKLAGAYVTYYNHKYSLSPLTGSMRTSACSKGARLAMGAPVVPVDHWSAFINATLACGAAKVTGHVWINGVETTKITGLPATVKLQPGYAKAVREKWARAEWTLYVNPTTYLPVRIVSSTGTFGGPSASTKATSVTNVRWLKPTAANVAKASVAIPPGFRHVASSANQ